MCRFSLQEVLTFPIVGPLVLQPLPILPYGTNLLTVVVGHGVTEGLERRIDTVLFDVL